MNTKNPFPGMNPFFEQRWRDAHTRLVAYISDALQERLPEDLVAGAEEDVVSVAEGPALQFFRPHVQIREQEQAGQVAVAPAAAIAVTQPILVRSDDEVERWVEIRDDAGRLITVIELLSPTNKIEQRDRERYLAKRRSFVSARVNLVEIDLVRQGQSIFPRSVREALARQGVPYAVCVFRAATPGHNAVYPIGLRDRLPVLAIPLRPRDADVPLDLQPLINQCHERGRYSRLDYSAPLDPPLSNRDQEWANRILTEKQLRKP